MGTNADESDVPDISIVKSETDDEDEIIAELECDYSFDSEDDEREDNKECPRYTLNDHDYFSQRASQTNGVSPDSLPRLEIMEEPCPLIRFRYLSELQGTPHGPLTGASSSKGLRTFPAVKLHNWVGEALIRCWLAEAGTDTTKPHVHDLVARKGKNTTTYEPHCRIVSKSNKYIARFENLVIIRTAKKEGVDKYYKKKLAFESSSADTDYSDAKTGPKDVIQISSLFNRMDKNSVCLFFEAVKIVDNRIKRLCCVKSAPVRNLKDPESSELKIVRSSRDKGSCEGGDEVLIFVKKIPKDIKIEFFEKDSSGNLIWMDFANFKVSDIHYDCAIAFKTPRYRKKLESGTKAEVFFRLYRVGDKAYSNEVSFLYQPNDLFEPPPHKRLKEKDDKVKLQKKTVAPDSTTQAATLTNGGIIFKPRKVPAILKNSAPARS